MAGSRPAPFQPSEEASDENNISGATAMIMDKALEGVDAVIALHVISDRPSGEFMFQDGPSLAAVDSFDAWVYGDGAHGAYPHAGSDPIFMLAPDTDRDYAIPSRRINPLYLAVISIGQVTGGATTNVIPNEVMLRGTMRSMLPEVREQSLARAGGRLADEPVDGGRLQAQYRQRIPGHGQRSRGPMTGCGM